MTTARLREIRLTSFKSFTDAVLPLSPVTVLTGRNSSGKSNALDGIEVLSRLAGGEDLSDALDGRRREAGAVRGGSQGCSPHGRADFELGCTVELDDAHIKLDVRIQVEPELRIVYERLVGPAPTAGSPIIEQKVLLQTDEPSLDSAGITVAVYNGKRGRNPTLVFRDNRLITAQLSARLSAQILPGNPVENAVRNAAGAVIVALRGIFHLDPVPHLMRDYVPSRDSELRRTGANVSAAVGRLQHEDPATFERLVEQVQAVSDSPVLDFVVSESDLGDVMLTLKEGRRRNQRTPAREMSDGLLRFLAIATALLSSRHGLDIEQDAGWDAPDGGVLLVIEEPENGLHPSQAARMFQLIEETARRLGTQVIFTTHSPPLLNALTGEVNEDVMVCYREGRRGSRLSRLTELPGYARAMASGRIGDLVSRGRMVGPEEARADYAAFNRILGIE